MSADLFVLPSSKEIWGLVLNEAMAYGLPVISTTSVGGSTDLINAGYNGYIVPPDNPRALMCAIRNVLSSSDTPQVMGANSRNKIIDFTIEKAAQGFIDAIKYVTNSKK